MTKVIPSGAIPDQSRHATKVNNKVAVRNKNRPAKLPLAPVHSTEELRRNSGESWYDHRSNAIWIGDEVPAESFSSVVAHEFNHFLVHASTPYGWFLDECVTLENNLVLSYCLDHYRRFPASPIAIPLYEVARLRDRGKQFQVVRNLCDKYVNPWSHLIFLVNLLEGENSPELDAANVRQASRSFHEVERLLAVRKIAQPEGTRNSGKAKPPLARVTVDISNLPGMPNVILPGGEQINVGAKHVFEGIATQHESKAVIVDSLRRGARLPYWTLWMMTVWKMGKERVRSQKDFDSLLNTFYAICDLALFVPAGSLYGGVRTREMAWFDIQPGSRFMTALRQATQLGWIDNLEKDMLPYQEWLSELLHWPSPKQFLKLGAGLKDVGSHSRRHAEACRVRLENHSAFIVLGSEFDAQDKIAEDGSSSPVRRFFRNHRPMLYTPQLGQLEVRDMTGEAREPLSQLLDWFFRRFNYQVMLGGPFSREDLLPENLKYHSVWLNLKSREELLDLVQQAIPLLTPDRFQSSQL